MSRDRPWRQFSVFCLLTVLLLALVPIASSVFGSSMDFGTLAEHASLATGVPWTSNLFDVVRLCRVEPGLWLLLLGSFVPTLAALILLTFGSDTSQWRRFVRRLRPVGESRASKLDHSAAYALLCFGMVAGLLAVFQLREVISPGEYDPPTFVSLPNLLMAFCFAALLDQGAVLEEGGWRGYAAPLLQDHGVAPLLGAVAVGVAWSFWHIPRDIIIGLPDTLGLSTYLGLYLPSFTLGTITTSIIAVYFMNRLGGSLIPAVIVHGLANDAIGFSGLATIERALTPFHQITKALPFALLCGLILLRSGSRLALANSRPPTGEARTP